MSRGEGRATKRVNRESTCKQATRETNNVGAAGCSPNEPAWLSRLSFVPSLPALARVCFVSVRRIYRISVAASPVPRRELAHRSSSVLAREIDNRPRRSIRNRFSVQRGIFKVSAGISARRACLPACAAFPSHAEIKIEWEGRRGRARERKSERVHVRFFYLSS